MQVHLRVYLEQPLLVDDGWLAQPALPQALLAELRAQPYLGGEIEFEGGDGEGAEGSKRLVIRDDLEQLVPRLCLFSLAPLEAGEAVGVDLFTDPARIMLSPQPDGRLLLTTPDGREESFDLAAALTALEACAERYAQLIERCFADDASRQMKLAPVQVALWKRQDARAENAPLMEDPPYVDEDDASPA